MGIRVVLVRGEQSVFSYTERAVIEGRCVINESKVVFMGLFVEWPSSILTTISFCACIHIQ